MIFINTRALLYFVNSLFTTKRTRFFCLLLFFKKKTFRRIDFDRPKLYSGCYSTSMRVVTEKENCKKYVYSTQMHNNFD